MIEIMISEFWRKTYFKIIFQDETHSLNNEICMER